jgi:hypothetical protein
MVQDLVKKKFLLGFMMSLKPGYDRHHPPAFIATGLDPDPIVHGLQVGITCASDVPGTLDFGDGITIVAG